jgi:hypothetical protein
MITLLQAQPFFTDGDKLLFGLIWGVLSIISANILLKVWDKEDGDDDELTLLSYVGAYFFGALMAPVITTLALLGWLGTITPKKANEWIKGTYNSAKEATIGHWRDLFGEPKGRKLIAKQAPPGGGGPTVGYGSNQILVHQNPPSPYTTTSGPFLNDLMNVKTRNTSSFQSGTFSAPPPPGPNPNMAMGANVARRINGGTAPSWYVPKAKKAAPKM